MNRTPTGGAESPRDRIASLVREEALRAEAQAQVRPDPARLDQGWVRRFVIEARRAEEYVRLYESIGYDVVADPVRREQVDDRCDDCRVVLLLDYRTIYTRSKVVSR